MNKWLYLLILVFILSCNQNSSQTERNYIKNLEEKNIALEKELQEIKNKSESFSNQSAKKNSENIKYFFIIGSTEDEVIEVMGEPTSYIKTAPEAKKFHYGISTVYFYQGKVISYDNLDDNLKVRVKR